MLHKACTYFHGAMLASLNAQGRMGRRINRRRNGLQLNPGYVLLAKPLHFASKGHVLLCRLSGNLGGPFVVVLTTRKESFYWRFLNKGLGYHVFR